MTATSESNAAPIPRQVESLPPSNRIPFWASEAGFTEFIIACRSFATHGTWPAGKPPKRPAFDGLAIWQIKWLNGQRNPVAYAEARSNRRRNKSANRSPNTLADYVAGRKGAAQ